MMIYPRQVFDTRNVGARSSLRSRMPAASSARANAMKTRHLEHTVAIRIQCGRPHVRACCWPRVGIATGSVCSRRCAGGRKKKFMRGHSGFVQFDRRQLARCLACLLSRANRTAGAKVDERIVRRDSAPGWFAALQERRSLERRRAWLQAQVCLLSLSYRRTGPACRRSADG